MRIFIIFLILFKYSSFLISQNKIALINANVIDGINPLKKNMTILIDEGKIQSIAKNLKPSKDYETLNMKGLFILPGFIDAHTHVRTIDGAKRALESGVTTARSANTPYYQDVSLREMVKSGNLIGPDIIAAGVFVTPNLNETILADTALGDLVNGVNNEKSLRKLVRINAKRGVDIIKTRGTERAGLPYTDPRKQTYTKKQLAIIVDEAAKYNLKVMAHAHGDEGGYAAVQAGVISIEHGTYLTNRTLQLMKKRKFI